MPSIKSIISDPPRSILITGASSGIGAALARHYAAPGIRLALSGRDPERLHSIADDCRAQGAEIIADTIDVTDAEAMRDWIEGIDGQWSLDLVIANAGISGGTGGAVGETEAQARAIFDVNLTGVLNTIWPVLPAMQSRRCGQIAIMSSLAAFSAWPGAPAYSAAKAAVRIYGEALRGQLRGSGVTVSTICPGFVKSRITDANDFPMPFFMAAERAAHIIANGLAHRKIRIAFPLPTLILSSLVALLPPALSELILTKLPQKSAIPLAKN